MKAVIRHSLALLLMLAMCISLAIPAAAAQTKSSYDFFKSVGAAKAMEILDTSKYKSYTHRGAANDATNLQNMLDSLDVIDKTNEYRISEGLSALKVTDAYMAMAQVNVNASAVLSDHSYEYDQLDNLFMASVKMSGADAAKSWYDEKDGHSYTKLHYLTMMDRNSGVKSTVSGAAISTVTGYVDGHQMSFWLDETFGTNDFNEKTYTVSQYRQRLKNYMNNQGTSTSAPKTNTNTGTATTPKKQSSSEVMTYTQSKPIMADSMGIGAPLFLNSSTALLAVPTNGKFEITVNGLEVYDGKLKITLNILNGWRDLYIKSLRNLKFYDGNGKVFFTIPYLNTNNYKSLYLLTSDHLEYYYSGDYSFGKISRCGVTFTMEYTYA